MCRKGQGNRKYCTGVLRGTEKPLENEDEQIAVFQNVPLGYPYFSIQRAVLAVVFMSC